MDSKKFVLQKTLVLTLGELVCLGCMFGVYALLDRLSGKVLLGGGIGLVLAVLNFFLMAVSADRAADQAAEQNVKGGQATMKVSYVGRMAGIFVLLIVFAKTGMCDLLALVLPLAFTQPVLIVTEFFRKSGEKKS